MKTNWRDWLKTVGVFTFMGPPIGWISMSTAATIAGAFTGQTTASDLAYFFPGLIFGSLWSYIIGGIPALASGMFVGIFKHRLTSFVSWCLAGVVGFVVTGVFFVWMQSKGWNDIEYDMFLSPLSYMGAVAAFVCAWIARPKKHILPPPLPSTSSEETP